jgi:hypothetical protein
MQFTKLLGLAAVGAVLALASPAERANALSLSNPAPPRRFRRTPSRRPRQCIGDTTIITAGIAHHRHHHHRHWRRW